MSPKYVVITKSALSARLSNVRYTSVEEALLSARTLLGDGAASVWIIDNIGNLILPAEQVRLRLRASAETLGATT